MEEKSISIVIPCYNEEANIKPLVERIHYALRSKFISYEIIFVDDNSTDNTQSIIKELSTIYPISLYKKRGKKGKAYSLLEGFTYTTYDLIAILDADLQYPPEILPEMVNKIIRGADIVIAKRTRYQSSLLRKALSLGFSFLFVRLLHQLPYDAQSGLKLFKKEILQNLKLDPKSGWTFDLEFLLKTREIGCLIDSIDIIFSKRNSGKPKINLFFGSLQIAYSALNLKMRNHKNNPYKEFIVQDKNGFYHKGKKLFPYSKLSHHKTALYRMSRIQILLLGCILFLFSLSLLINALATVIVVIAFLTFVYFADLLFNLFLVYRSFSRKHEINISRNDIDKVKDYEWPTYTILCPLYKEMSVLTQFVNAIQKLEYPKAKLQVLLLLEDDDKDTIEKATQLSLPSYFNIILVPQSSPKTKPKACNFGLLHAAGEYLVIYDAEDIPDPFQLKKAVLTFRSAGNLVVCIQAKLNYYNTHQNILTRLFTAEYSLWFDLVLTGLQSINAPIPLGGTSNHFKTYYLKLLGGWDAFNVTEDCDLGMRIVKNGYSTAVMDSTTLEEANSNPKNWFNQRTRWIKGYIQTYFVHMRNPLEFKKGWKNPHLITFQFIVGAKILSIFINPIMWGITLSYFLAKPFVGEFIESFFPSPVLYMGVFSLVFGNFLYMYYYMLGCAKRDQDDLIKYALLIPFYWLGMSFAGWNAVYGFIKQPHYWAKTRHGLHLDNQKNLVKMKRVVNNAVWRLALQQYK